MSLRAKRQIPVTPEMIELLEEQMDLFEERFGYSPGPEDPVFFDPELDTPTRMDADKMRGKLEEMIVGLDGETQRRFRLAFNSDMSLDQVNQRAEVEKRMSRRGR